MSRRLLVLKCSARKRNGAELLPAVERYDGPLWQVWRSARRDQPLLVSDVDVYVLSAAFGLISADKPIPWYDRTMAPERADELRPAVLAAFEALLQQGYANVCLGLSQRYLRALDGWEKMVPATAHVTLTDGPMGTKLGQLRAWLYSEAWGPSTNQPQRLVAPEQPRGRVRLGGKEIVLSRAEVLSQARAALGLNDPGARRYRSWYVLIDDQRVAPKWLVSLISGQPTSAFDASAARRVLLALGLNVERVPQ